MSTDKKTISSYNKNAEKWATKQRSGTSIYHRYLEKPAMYSKLPSLKDKDVLCVGCGSGEEVKFIHSLGVKKVVGVDISKKLIDIAKKSYPDIEFFVMDVEQLDFPADSFNFIFSSLTMHYLESWIKALRAIHKVLKKDGIFLFSMTHPFFSATELTENEVQKSRVLGYKDIKNSDTCKIYGNYLDPSKREVKINKEMTVTNYHRSLSIIIKELTQTGFDLLDIVEPKALEQSKKDNPKFWEIHQKIPEFIVFELIKK